MMELGEDELRIFVVVRYVGRLGRYCFGGSLCSDRCVMCCRCKRRDSCWLRRLGKEIFMIVIVWLVILGFGKFSGGKFSVMFSRKWWYWS